MTDIENKDFVNEKEMELLMQDSRKWYQKVFDIIKTPSLYLNKLTIFTIINIVVLFIAIIIVMNNGFSKKEEKFGLISKLESLKQSHNYYRNVATKNEMLYSWIKLFSNWSYESGGDPRYNKGDCVGAVYGFLKEWNSNVYFENVNGIVRRAKNLHARGELKIRKKISEIRTGDIIIIQLKKNEPEHVGIVYDIANKNVRFMDVNGGVKTWGLERYKYGSKKIYAIYEMSYSLWIGDYLQKLNY